MTSAGYFIDSGTGTLAYAVPTVNLLSVTLSAPTTPITVGAI
jgi:hypothetical protein